MGAALDAAVLYGRSFTLLTTQAAARLTPAEQNIFQQTAALPRLNQNAVYFGLGNRPIEATSTARPERFLGCPPCSKQPNDPSGQAGGIPVAHPNSRFRCSGSGFTDPEDYAIPR